MEIHKQREKEKGISEQGNNNARMGRLLYENVGREKRRRRSRNTNEGEAEGAGGNRNHSGRGGKTDKDKKKLEVNVEKRKMMVFTKRKRNGYASEKVERLRAEERWMCGAEREGQRYGQAREKEENQKIEVQQGV
jgi:hypothetical protein